MKSFIFAAFVVFQSLNYANAQTTVTLVNNTSLTVYAAYAIYDNEDGWTTRGWYSVAPYKKRDIDLDDYSGSVYIHGHNSEGSWGDTRLCTGGDSAFRVVNADKIRCEYYRNFYKLTVSSGQTKKTTFNP